ncbi:MAG: AgmX/PglI C-terminal domain-containing protein [Myxococcota bacterium]|nr:AgmX/PglI C-terminal domain-containing protein [Myxococcota bacterium]
MSNQNPPIKFDIYDGSQLIQTEVLVDNTIKIGRLSSSHLKLDDSTISRMHAVIEVHGSDDVVILDLGSDSGTWVNGDRVKNRKKLNSGDRITIGRFTVVLTMARPKDQAKPGSRPSRSAAKNIPLFDQDDDGPGVDRALEVLVMWGQTVTDVTHLTEDGEYTIGEAKDVSHFAPEALLPGPSFPLAQYMGGMMVVNVPDGVPGQVMLDDQVFGLDQLAAAGKLNAGAVSGSRGLKLPPRGRCRLKIGGQYFLINSVPAPSKIGPLPLIQAFDPQFLRYLLVGFCLHALVALILALYPAGATGLDFDDWSMEDRFAEMMFDEEKERLEEQKNFLKKMKEEGEQSAKAKDRQGKAGKKNEKKKDRRMAIEGPQDNKKIELAKKRAREEAVDTAKNALNQLDQMSAAFATANTAIGRDAVHAIGGLQGAKIGASSGFGGLGLAGVGEGGGGLGTSVGIGSVGTLGRGSGGKGTGYGRGKARTVKRTSKMPTIVLRRPKVSGGLDMETVRRIIRRSRNRFKYCYEQELQRNPDLAGKVKVKFVISGQGKVLVSQVIENTMKNQKVGRCIKRMTNRLQFPAARGGGTTTVRYPFMFKGS